MRTQTLPVAALHAIARIEHALSSADRERAAKVAAALGFRKGWKPNRHLGETATHITAWSQHELNAVYERTGGTVTTRTVQRTACDGDATWPATEITVTIEVPGVGYVEIETDWDEESGGHDLPLIQAIPDATLITS